MSSQVRVCVFCGSSTGARPAYVAGAQQFGACLARRGFSLVFGGGRIGLMGKIADAVLEAGGEVIGVIPQALEQRELAHQGLSELRIVDSMHERKAMMAELADAFIALPGGYGTLDEFCEILTWVQLGIQRKPCGILNVEGYYDSFLQFLDHAVSEGFLHPAHRNMVVVESEPEALLERLFAAQLPDVDKVLSALRA